MGLIFLLSPFLVALSDQATQRMHFLTTFMLIAVGATLLPGLFRVLVGSLVCAQDSVLTIGLRRTGETLALLLPYLRSLQVSTGA